MEHIIKYLRLWPAAIAGGIAGVFGGWDTMIMVLLAFMVIDYATGLAIGWLGLSPKTPTGHLDSTICKRGLARKLGELVAVIVGVLLDMLFMDAVGYSMPIFRTAIIIVITTAEAISILENLGILGVPLPSFVFQALEQLHAQADRGNMVTASPADDGGDADDIGQ